MGADAALPALERHGAAAVLLLQAALRAGHQPGDRLAARGPRDEPDDVARPRPGSCSPTRRRRRRRLRLAVAGADRRGPRRACARVAAAVGAAGRHLADLARRRRAGGGGRAAGRRGGQRRRRRARRSSSSATAASVRTRAPIPSLLAVAAVHHELVRARAAHALLAGRRLRRAARGPPRRLPGRLRRRRRPRLAGGRRDRPRAGHGAAEGDVEDGRLDRLRLPRRAGVRGDRARARS